MEPFTADPLRIFDLIVRFRVCLAPFSGSFVASYVHYYAIFFLGISEVSSIPLSVVDVFKYFPEVAAR